MYLSNLEIIGFKSFADKTEFKFNEGITCFVGPNGSGKTNVVDAIRWVLGEQRSSVLRSEAMENVIFNGTSSRKPLGMAEVSLTIQNNKKILPVEFSEVKITRRLFRDGESQYLLNNTVCRLKDIVDLFMDTGMGAGSYSVIELKMVETILNGRSEERRYLIEEAAGINKYKTRRKDCSKKLIAVQENLTRLKDILSEIQKNVASLSRQAGKTQKYNKLFSELKTSELNLLKIEFLSHQKNIEALTKQIEELNAQKIKLSQDLLEAESYLSQLEKKQNEVNVSYKEIKEKESQKYSEIAHKNQEIAIIQEKINSHSHAIAKLKQEIAEITKTLNSNANSLVDNNQKFENLKTQKSQLQTEFENNKFLEQEARNELFLAEEEYNSIRNEINSIESKVNQIATESQRNVKQRNSISAKINELTNQIIKSEEQITQLNNQIEVLEKEEQKLIEQIKEQNIAVHNARQRKQTLQDEITEAQNNILKLTQELSQYEAKLELLNNLVDTTESSKYLLENKNWQIDGEKTFLGDVISCKDEHRIAIESCLGESAKFFLVETRQEAMNAIFALTENNKGKATFIIKGIIPLIAPPDAEKLPPNAIGWLSELVDCEDKLKSILRILLEDIVLFDSWESANLAIEQKQCKIAVTLKGEIVDARGLIKGGSTLSSEGEQIAKKQRKAIITDKIKCLNEEISALQTKILQLSKENESIDVKKLTDAELTLKKRQDDIRQRIIQLRYQAENLNNNIAIFRQNIAQLETERDSLDFDEAENTRILEELHNKLNEYKDLGKQCYNKLAIARSNYEGYRKDVHNIEIQLTRLDAECNNTQKEIERLNTQKTSLNNKLNSINEEQEKSSSDVQRLKLQLEQENTTLGALQTQYNEILGKSAYWSQELKSITEQVQHHTNNLLQLRKQYDRLIDALHQVEIKIKESAHQIANIEQRAQEFYQTDIKSYELAEPPESYEKQKLTDEIRALKDKITALGTINFMALDEYQAQSQRLKFYEEQLRDLVESEKQLQTAIVEINRTAEEVFLKTFEEIRKNFKEIFKTLFGKEGDCDLRIIEDDLLEGDIEIIAKPPGKRPHSIDVLSGGEKTLTAIAFLFSIYMVKPSPFCFLDEVDAPLDDANIDKFLTLIKKFSESTQFIIATHNKRTMEFANTLYGITMQEDGVSKVISVKLNHS